MHLWPSTRIRDSFKIGYLRNLEWNLNRMKSEKHEPSSNQKLLGKEEPVANGRESATPSSEIRGGALAVFREIVMVLSCCFCVSAAELVLMKMRGEAVFGSAFGCSIYPGNNKNVYIGN
ncbi:hypothetical protein SLA2020_402660 [Shorea laevis]